MADPKPGNVVIYVKETGKPVEVPIGTAADMVPLHASYDKPKAEPKGEGK